ncbi:MAG: CoA-binding protein [Deltaproteobacteria bacterium]|nr:CoA-binding protein [Candidatus Zymogenaceae bacterium]
MAEQCEIPAGNPDSPEIDEVLKTVKTIAVVGLSPKEDRPSYRVASYLQAQGYRIVPVRPAADQILGERVYGDLSEIPDDITIDMVDIFRRPDEVMPIVEAAIARGDVKAVWMQEGIVNNAAREAALAKGLSVVMDRCAMKEHRRMREEAK